MHPYRSNRVLLCCSMNAILANALVLPQSQTHPLNHIPKERNEPERSTGTSKEQTHHIICLPIDTVNHPMEVGGSYD